LIFRRTRAIVLKRTDYSETSKIVTFYTRDRGKVRALAKGARRKKSEFLGILEPLSVLEIVYIEKREGLHILKEAHLIASNLALREHLPRISHALNFLSLIDKTQAEEDADPDVFEVLLSSLSALQHISHSENVAAAFQLSLLRHVGRLPSLQSCGRCGTPLTAATSFDARSGDFRCRACGKKSEWSLPQGTLRALRRLAEVPLERCGRIRMSKGQHAEISHVVGAMLRSAIEADLPADDVVSSLLR
jgi:DNA repair protein RecO (recombination protein O)